MWRRADELSTLLLWYREQRVQHTLPAATQAEEVEDDQEERTQRACAQDTSNLKACTRSTTFPGPHIAGGKEQAQRRAGDARPPPREVPVCTGLTEESLRLLASTLSAREQARHEGVGRYPLGVGINHPEDPDNAGSSRTLPIADVPDAESAVTLPVRLAPSDCTTDPDMPELIPVLPQSPCNTEPSEADSELTIPELDLGDASDAPVRQAASVSFRNRKGGLNSCWGSSALRAALRSAMDPGSTMADTNEGNSIEALPGTQASSVGFTREFPE